MGFFNELTFNHVRPFVGQARRGDIPLSDLHLPDDKRADNSYTRFQVRCRDTGMLHPVGNARAFNPVEAITCAEDLVCSLWGEGLSRNVAP